MDANRGEGSDAVAAVGALEDELRRGMYLFIRRAHRPISREEAAESVGISRKLAAFHLDKLVDAGLLRTRFDAPDRPRGVGRAPKLYEPSPGAIRVSIPERRHEMLARILADAVLTPGPARDAQKNALDAATRHGQSYGSEQRTRLRPGRLGTERALSLAASCLEEFGFEPERAAPDLVILHNCPFHPLAEQSPELVCGINQHFLGGFLDGLGAGERTEAVLQPDPATCCVRLCRRGESTDPGSASEVEPTKD